MAPRAYWKGYLKLSLVSCPIALYPAIDASQRVAFRQINRATGHRVRHQLVDSVTGEAVDVHEKGRGYEVGENQFAVVEDEELEQARIEARSRPFGVTAPDRISIEQEPAQPASGTRNREELRRAEQLATRAALPPPRPRVENTRTIDIERFFPRSQIDARYHLTPYYIAPRDVMRQEAFAVIRDAMDGKGVVGLGHIVLSNRERPIILEPLGLGLSGITLRYAHEIRGEAEYFADIPKLQLPGQMVDLAEHIVDAKNADFDAALLEDHYRTSLVSMLQKKEGKVRPRQQATAPSRQNVVNLMDILQRSLATERPPSNRRKPASRRALATSAKAASSKRAKARPKSSSQ
jgi:non-homologous end joining protein Ku